MARRTFLLICAALALGSCGEPRGGLIAVSAIGAPPRLLNPNLQPLDPPAAFLAEAVAQGLVRFDAAGEIEPALAQSWIVSDDGLRYTFRIRRSTWPDGSPITAEQVAGRLRAAASRASRNPLKPVLGGIESITAMTDAVLEIGLRGPRPNLLQLLAQPEMAIVFGGMGSGPYQAGGTSGGAPLLSLPAGEDGEPSAEPPILLRGEGAALAVAASPAARPNWWSSGRSATCRSRAPPTSPMHGCCSIRSRACSACPSPAGRARSPTPRCGGR